MFDESFVRAARIQELSASERLGGGAGSHSTRRRGMRGLPRQALALMLLIALAFAAAVYMGVRHPYPEVPSTATQLSIEIVPLQPGPSASPSRKAAAGAVVPSLGDPWGSATAYQTYVPFDTAQWTENPHATTHFTKSQVNDAMRIVWGYLGDSTDNPAVLSGRDTDAVAKWLTAGQRRQFDASISAPARDGRHELTGWMVRFNQAEWVLATTEVRVAPSSAHAITFSELEDGSLEVVSDYTSVYALLPARDPQNPQALTFFSVRRQIHYRLTAADIAENHVELVHSVVQAGPMACEDPGIASYLTPYAAATAAASGASAVPGVDPADHSQPADALCGRLAG
ncbi:hypothetical protein ACFQZC_26365 [Streptacidiphilus monticola]